MDEANAAKIRLPGRAKTIALVLVTVALNALGNLSLAWGMRHAAPVEMTDPLSFVRPLIHPAVMGGIALLILWLLTRMTLLSWADLSFVLPLTSIGYVLAAVLGVTFLGETVNVSHWVGTLLIFAGSTLVSTTAAKTTEASR